MSRKGYGLNLPLGWIEAEFDTESSWAHYFEGRVRQEKTLERVLNIPNNTSRVFPTRLDNLTVLIYGLADFEHSKGGCDGEPYSLIRHVSPWTYPLGSE